MIRFPLGRRPGRMSLRLLLLTGIMLCLLSGCSESRFEAVDLQMPGTEMDEETVFDDTKQIVLGENGDSKEETVHLELEGPEASENQSEKKEESVYQETNDYLIVTADILNVRESDSTDARIFVQLPKGEILHRNAYNEEWCRIDYDGGMAFVSAEMVEVTEAPVPETEAFMAMNPEIMKASDAGEDAEPGADLPKETELQIPWNGHTVAIDAGRQAKANTDKEPIGPASQTKKAKMPEGAVGTATGVKEYELTLTVAKQLREELAERGYEVVMIRESHDVNLSQAERSAIANDSGAEILIRLYANSMENSSIYGAMASCMTEHNPYNSELSSDSYRLSKSIVNNICANTGTKNRGVQKVDNSSAVNWCSIPVSVVEMGFLTNPDEDRWLQTEEYQGKIVDGISDAVDQYFDSANDF